MSIVHKNASLLLSTLLHITIFAFCVLRVPIKSFVRFDSLQGNQLIVIESVSLGDFNNIKLFSQKGTVKEQAVYNEKYNRAASKSGELDKKPIPAEKKEVLQKKTKKIEKKKQEIGNAGKPSAATKVDPQKKDSSKNEIASILKSVQKSQDVSKVANTKDNQEGVIGKGKVSYDPNQQASIQATDSIRSKFIKCWTVPIGAKNAENLRVKVQVSLAPNGKVISANVTDNYEYNHNPFFRAMADSAIRAVYRCSPLSDLPAEQYHVWREIELYFDPKEMF